MLVLTTIFISVMQTLPKTAYVKHIDIWLIFCQLIPFTEVLLITAAESLRPGNMSGLIPFNHHGQTRVIQVAPEEGGGVAIKAQEGKTGKSARDWIIFAGRLKTYRILAIPANLLQLTIKTLECVVVPTLVLLFSVVYISISVFYFYEEADISIV